jgi:hypothetical protein
VLLKLTIQVRRDLECRPRMCVCGREKKRARGKSLDSELTERRVTRVSRMMDPAGGFLVGMLQVGNDDSSLEL